MSANRARKKRKRNGFRVTLPAVVMESLRREASELQMVPGDYVRHALLCAYTQEHGAVLNLRPRVAVVEDATQLRLFSEEEG
jgi:hypothetical protein